MSDPVNDSAESLFEAPPLAEQERMVEAILFATAEPIGLADLNARMPHGADAKVAIEALSKRYEGRGVQVVRVGEGYAFRTAGDLGFLMRKDLKGHLAKTGLKEIKVPKEMVRFISIFRTQIECASLLIFTKKDLRFIHLESFSVVLYKMENPYQSEILKSSAWPIDWSNNLRG